MRLILIMLVIGVMLFVLTTEYAAAEESVAAQVDQVTQASPVTDNTALSTDGLDGELAQLTRQLDRLAKDQIWKRRRLVKQIDDLNIELLTAGVLDYVKLTYQSSDGRMIPAYIFKTLKPALEAAPAVIFVHGGQHGRFRSSSLKHVEQLVQRGYVVLAPDYRGSSGYSQDFYEAADYGGLEIDDMLAARDFLADLSEVNAEKIAIMGMSHGGYNSLMALIRAPGKFTAGIDLFGPTDLVWRLTATSAENPNVGSGDREEFARMIGKSIEEAPELYRARSPRYLADQIYEPLLILHGDEDSVVLLQESQWLAAALEEAGKTNYAFHVIKGANHGHPEPAWEEGWKLVFDFLERVFSLEPENSPEQTGFLSIL